MVAGDVATVIRAPGRIVIDPTDLSTAYPYGGTEIGKANLCMVQPVGRPFLVEYESLGETGAVLNPDNRYLFSCFLRGWDDDAVEEMMAHNYQGAGGNTQHAVYAPQTQPGTDATGIGGRAVILLYVPDDLIHVPAVLIYQGVPDWSENAELMFQRGDELGMALTVVCVRDANDNQIAIGRFEDLSLT